MTLWKKSARESLVDCSIDILLNSNEYIFLMSDRVF